jgi:signal transduction histidine kinase
MNDEKTLAVEANPQFRERLHQERQELLITRYRLLLIVACFVYPSFLGLDAIDWRPFIGTFAVIRAVVVANYLVCLALLYTKFGRRIALPLSMWGIFASEGGIAVMTVYQGGFTSVYYIGIVLAVFVAGLFLPWRATTTGLSGLFCMVSYFLVNVRFAPPANWSWSTVVTPLFFMGGGIVLTLFSNVGQERSRRRDLALRMQIETANEELKELDKTKMRFFSNVSHELRSPLTLILGPLEAMLSAQPPADPRPLLEAMDSNARRLLRQVNTLLDFAKIDAGKLECKFAFGNIGRLLEELFRATRPHTERRKIDLTIDGADTIPDSILDQNKVETIAANLISNAVKFTPAGGKIAIRASFDEERISFEVEDSGSGIPEDQIDLIFERFRQLDDALSRRAEGTGLGLSMVKELTALHGGRVMVRSKVGVGTTFTIELPRRPEQKPIDRRRIIGRRKVDQMAQERTISMLGAEQEQRSGAKTLLADVVTSKLGGGVLIDQEIKQLAPADAQKVLVVDDNPDIRTFMASNLATDFRIALAGDGVEALEVARRFQPDLIVSDIMMPRMDGYELCRQIRQDKTLGQIPIILATSKSGGEAVVTGLETGANDYLAKPFEIRELKARVAAQLRAHRLERSLGERESRLAAIGQMTSSIVHDLKNPLNTIVGFAEIAREDAAAAQSKDLLQDVEPIVSEAKRLGRMIAEVLDFARGYSANLKLEPTPLGPFLNMAAAPWKTKLEQMGVTFTVDLRIADTLKIDLDADNMMRIVENLLKNSLEALCGEGRDPRGKHVWLCAEAANGTVSVRVADDGPGIREEIAGRLFEPFATAGKKSGTGLGLATVRNLVKAQNGDIAVTPTAPEGGAAFVMTFPRKED